MKAVVTGAASGIGAGLVARLRRDGWDVVACDIQGDTTRLDVRDAAAWERVLPDDLDLLCNVAGVLRPGWVHETAPDAVDFHVDVNVKGVMHGTMAAARRMVPRKRGHIVNIASLAGIAPIPGIALYSASKFAVRGFSLAAAQELREHGVAVSVVCPDAVATPMLDLQRNRAEAAMTFSGNRELTVEEVVEAIVGAIGSRAVEVTLPRGRGILARLGALAPGLAQFIAPQLMARGRKRQLRG